MKIILLLILVIAAFFRLFDLVNLPPGLYPDEAMNGNNALEALRTGGFSARGGPALGWKVFYTENNGREGLFINIQALFLKVIGKNEPWVLRLPSAIFGILTVLGIYLLTKELFEDKKIALLSAFLIATSFWHINFSRIGFRAIMAPFFITWTIYLLLLSFRKLKHWSLPIISGLMYGFGLYSYIAYRATPLILLTVLGFYWRKQFLLYTLYFLLFSSIVAAPLGWYFLNNPQDFLGRTAQISIFDSQTPFQDLGRNILKTAGMFNIAGDYNWRHNFSGRPLLFWPVGILFLIGLFFGIKNIRSSPNLVLISWLVVAALPVVVSNEGLPHALRAILMAPPVFILSAIGGIKIHQFAQKAVSPRLLSTFYFLLATLLVFEAYFTYFIAWGQHPMVAAHFNQNYVEIARNLNSLPQELPKYVVVKAPGVDVRGIPMPAQTVMFITDTFSAENQKIKNIRYLLPEETAKVPADANVFYLD